MKCLDCTLKKICRVYQMQKEFEHEIDFGINTCSYKTVSNQTIVKKETIQETTEKTLFADSFDQDEYNRLLSKMNNEEVEDINNTIIECKTCNGKDYLSEIKACSICGTEICGNCGTSDNGRIYCQKCWEEL